ncbi:MAG: aminodeoxychorismate synthase component I [Desulfotomaculum sp.]|nr:aminodeoxychorismate synthase component I [Desulfotomaculum sp.]
MMGIDLVTYSCSLNSSTEEIFEKLKAIPYGFLLDTSLEVKGLGHFSFLGADPFMIVKSKDGVTELFAKDDQNSYKKLDTFHSNPLEVLKQLAKQYALDFKSLDSELKGIPLIGGMVGFFSYDFGRQLENIPDIALDHLNTPDFVFGLYDVIIAVDNKEKKLTIISTGFEESGKRTLKRASERMKWAKDIIKVQKVEVEKPLTEKFSVLSELKSNFTKEEYERAVKRAIEHILCGDIFQVNLSQRFNLSANIEGFDLYKRLKKINPSPMAAYLNFGDFEIISSSPERFLKLDADRIVETCPIKGTRPRGENKSEDEKNYIELKNSLKDRAELTMIIDLERNDLGKVCEVGTIGVEDCFRIETYPTVFHLVATVTGKLSEDKDFFDLIAATFPGGSITGAPKIKAMEIIERLEPVRRGVYTGSIGYISFDGRADFNIAIRTIVKKGRNYYFHVGGGLTCDSDPEAEYFETLDKAKALIEALGLKKENKI